MVGCTCTLPALTHTHGTLNSARVCVCVCQTQQALKLNVACAKETSAKRKWPIRVAFVRMYACICVCMQHIPHTHEQRMSMYAAWAFLMSSSFCPHALQLFNSAIVNALLTAPEMLNLLVWRMYFYIKMLMLTAFVSQDTIPLVYWMSIIHTKQCTACKKFQSQNSN